MFYLKIRNSGHVERWEFKYTDKEFIDDSFDIAHFIQGILKHSVQEASISIEYEEVF